MMSSKQDADAHLLNLTLIFVSQGPKRSAHQALASEDELEPSAKNTNAWDILFTRELPSREDPQLRPQRRGFIL